MSAVTNIRADLTEHKQSCQALSQVICYWRLEGKDVHLIRVGDKLFYEISYQFGKGPRVQIDIPNGRSIEDGIANLIKLTPIIKDDGSVHFSRQIPSSGAIQTVISKIDNEVTVDHNSWAVTLVDDIVSTGGNPLLMGGHANILIEGIDQGVYFMKKWHLVSGSRPEVGKLEEKDIKDFKIDRIHKKTETWVRSKNEIQRMLNHLDFQKSEQEQGKPQVILNLGGQGSIWASRPEPWAERSEQEIRIHNCFTWAREQLSLANIYLYSERIEDSLKAMFPSIVEAPRLRIDPASIFSKERVKVLAVQTYPDNIFRTTVDVTAKIHQKVGPFSWKTNFIDEFYTDGSICTLKVRVAAIVNVKRTDMNGMDKKFHVEKTVLQIKVRGRGVQNIEVTDEIQRKLEDTDLGLHWTPEVPETEEERQQMMDLARATFERLQKEEAEQESCIIQ